VYTLNYQYENEESLTEYLEKNALRSQKECLVQLFCGVTDEKSIQNVLNTLVSQLPDAHIIGATTDGEISSINITSNEIIISISVFEKSTISSCSIVYEDSSFEMGKSLTSQLDSEDVKAMILFTTGLKINGEEFQNGVRTISQNNYIVAGGMAGDNGEFQQTYVMHNKNLIPKGAVGVALKGSELIAKNSYSFGWDAIGLPMIATKSDKNRVYEINNTPVIDIYKKYFGHEISDLLPKVGFEIPLILTRDGNKIARACINKFDDNSLLFAGNILEGEEVCFGVGNSETILKDSQNLAQAISSSCSFETVFVYSCMARRHFLKTKIFLALEALYKNSSVSGFFTYGEFFSDTKNNYLFNETMTVLTLNESECLNNKELEDFPKEIYRNPKDNIMVQALVHLISTIVKEWQERLNEEVEKNKMQEKHNFQQSKLAQMGEMISMIAHQWRQPLNAISATGINLSFLSDMDMLDNEKVQKSSEFIQNQCQVMSKTIDTFMNFVKPAKDSKGFKLSHTIEAIMQIMGAQLENHNIKVNIETTDDNISIVGHEDLLEQVILNLLSNARDAFEEIEIAKKFINITIDIKDDIPIITIEDNAGGVSQEIQDKIFNPYFTTKEQGKGTGIGLYMSLDIMRKSFHGDLVFSTTDSGSRFEVICGGGRKNINVKQ